MLSVDKFPYPRKQTRGNEFIPCSNNICDILKRFRSFKIPAITLIWPKSSYKHSVTRSYRSGKESGRRSESPLWRHQWRSFVFISHADDVKREIRLHISRLLTNQKRESARSMGYPCPNLYNGLIESLLKLWHGRVIASTENQGTLSCIYAIASENDEWISNRWLSASLQYPPC